MNDRTSVLSRIGSVRTAVMTLFAALVVTLAFAPGLAHAENSVASSSPLNGATIAASPPEIIINFAEEVGDAPAISLSCEATNYRVGEATLSGSAKIMTVPVLDTLPKGVCLLQWRVNNLDGEANGDGLITFTVQNAAPPTTVEPDPAAVPTTVVAPAAPLVESPASEEAVITDLSQVETGTGPLWLGRLLSTLGIAVVFGSLVVIAAAWPEGVEYLITVRFVRAAWVLSLIGTLLFVAAATAASTGGSLGSGFSPGSWPDLVDAGWAGRAALLRLVLVLASAWAAFRPDRVIDPVTQLAALGVPALAVVTIGIGRTDGSLAAVGVILAILHALSMAVWLGGAVLLGRVVLAGPGEEDLVHAVRGFGRLSGPAIILTVITGVGQMLRIDGGDLFTSSHGRVVVLKAVLVAAMVFIGLSARQIVQQRLVRAHELTVPMADRLRRAFGIEAGIGVVTLMASSWLLVLTPVSVVPVETIDYAYSGRVEVAEAGLDVRVRLTTTTVGNAGLEVRVEAPEEDLSQLQLIFTAPPNTEIDTITQPVPLTGPGTAVLRADSARPLPLSVAGTWTLQVSAQTASGPFVSEPTSFAVVNIDGSLPTTTIALPPQVVVTIDPNATTTLPPVEN